jgi:2-polyprenyl-3-methyl-5-hydroxy-6-metoxy-1,4-benzoquinol methylase
VDGDRERWNARWRERAGELEDPSAFLSDHAMLLPAAGKVLDLAGGAGRNGIWFARRGCDVTLVDVSDVALDKAEARAKRLGIANRMRFLRVDLEAPLPFAPLFDVVLVVHYLDRMRRDSFAELLHDNGMLIAANPTITNRERHAHPSERFLVERGELASWVCNLGFDLLATREDWTVEGMHEASVIARKRPRIAGDTEPHESGPTNGPYR